MTIQMITSILQRTLRLLGRALAFLLALILCIPVLLLPQATATPA